MGCATVPPAAPHLASAQLLPQVRGSYYVVQKGETLWGIAHDFGIELHTLARANRLPDVKAVRVGQRLFIPAPAQTDRFLWPARPVSAAGAGGPARQAVGHGRNIGTAAAPTLEIRAAAGTFVRAARSGRVAVAARKLAGWGKTVIVDHGDGYLTIYGGLDQILVSPGVAVAQGNALGRLGEQPLYFEIRQGVHRRDPLRLLP